MELLSDDYKTGALDGGLGRLNVGSTDPNGDLVLRNAALAELAQLQLSNPAFAAATINAGIAEANANAITKDTSITVDTIAKLQLRNRDNTVIIQGTVGTVGSGADFEIGQPIIPPGTDEIECDALTIAQALT